ncbi:MAG: phosphate/phosphite/phosphonate ABC transporter substrate-binding protein [Candidatus Edwardsbacteria bacterium]
MSKSFHLWRSWNFKVIHGARLILFFSLICLTGCGEMHRPTLVKQKVKISIVPTFSLEMTTKCYKPLLDYLANETGYEIEYMSALDYENYLSTVAGARVEIGYQNPALYLTLKKTCQASPLAIALGSNESKYSRGIIITYQGSEIEKITDLRGQGIGITSERALGGFLSQRALCQREGLNLEREAQLVYFRTQDEILRKVIEKKLKAGFVRQDVVEMETTVWVSGRSPILKIIAYTDSFPNWCFASFDHTPKEVAIRIKEALLKLNPANPKHQEILKTAGISGFAETSEEDFLPVKKLLQELQIAY